LTEAKTSDIVISPNPATDNVMISIPSEIETAGLVRVFASNGQLVFQQQVNLGMGTTQISLSVIDFAEGLYEVVVSGEGITKKAKLILE
jgi:hypothetical protein